MTKKHNIMPQFKDTSASSRSTARAERAKKLAAIPTRVARFEAPKARDTESFNILDAAENLLEQTGIQIIGDCHAQQIFLDAGAEKTDLGVRFPRGMIMSLVNKAPSNFTHIAPNNGKSLNIGELKAAFSTALFAQFITDRSGNRRPAAKNDLDYFTKLSSISRHFHQGGACCDPTTIPLNERHLDIFESQARYSDLPIVTAESSAEQAADNIAMAKILFGSKTIAENCALMTHIQPATPLSFSADMLNIIKIYAEAGQATLIRPMALLGVNTPINMMQALATCLAEALVAMAYSQLCREGAPTLFAVDVYPVSMRNGVPTIASPKGAAATSQLAEIAKYINVPFAAVTANTGAKQSDAEAGADSAFSLTSSIQTGVNLSLSAAGGLEGGLTISQDKFGLDCNIIARIAEHTEALKAPIREMDVIKPASHFMDTEETLSQTRLTGHMQAHSSTYEQWVNEGRSDAAKLAYEKTDKWLEHVAPPKPNMDAIIELEKFIAKRRATLPKMSKTEARQPIFKQPFTEAVTKHYDAVRGAFRLFDN